MGKRGVRQKNPAKQVDNLIKEAASALLGVMHLLGREQVVVTDEGQQYLDAAGRRVDWIKERLKNRE